MNEDIRDFSFRADDINLDRSKLSRLLGFDGELIPAPISGQLAYELSLMKSYAEIRGGIRLIDSFERNKENYSITVADTRLSLGRQIYVNLKDAEILIAFVCTAGQGFGDRMIAMSQHGLSMEGYLADLLGSLTVEYAMDLIQENLRKEFGQQGRNISNRYSPGYCDWPVSDQAFLFSLFPKDFCGITLTQSSMMIPVKSVSGIIGAGKDLKYYEYKCETCSSKDCIYRLISNS